MCFATVLLLASIGLRSSAFATPPRNYLFISSGNSKHYVRLLQRKDIEGVQIVYNWKALETAKGIYDFSAIEEDLKLVNSLHKKLFIQIQDRFFEIKARNVPAYLLTELPYKGGIVQQVDNPGENKRPGYGWVAIQWNPAVQIRFQKLIAALAKRFDGRIYGINLPETAIDIDMKHDRSGFSCDKYFEAEMANMKFAKKSFTKSQVVQYVNFFPCEWNNDHKFMSRLFATASVYGVGIGGPDIIPGKKAQMNNSYPFFNRYKGKLRLVAMAVQEPTLTYKNPKTGKPFSKEEFSDYAHSFLGADIIFWSTASPWLRSR